MNTRNYTEAQREHDALKSREYYWEHAEDRRNYANKRRAENPDEYQKARRKSVKKLIYEVLTAYGGRCVCCGEDNMLFLTLDHINGGGSAHRKAVGGSSYPIYRDLRKRGYPAGYQTLCFNCNCGRARNSGVCPHKSMIMQDGGSVQHYIVGVDIEKALGT